MFLKLKGMNRKKERVIKWLFTVTAFASLAFLVGIILVLFKESFQGRHVGIFLSVITGLIAGWVMQKAGHALAPAFYRAFAVWLMFLQ